MNREIEAKKLKQLWKEKSGTLGLTYKKAAKQMGLGENYSAVSHMLNGRNVINLDRGLQFCDMLGIALGDFSPRLSSKLASLSDNNERLGDQEMVGDVGWLVGVDSEMAKKILDGKEKLSKKIYWAGKHSANTFAMDVKSEANHPQLPNKSTAIVDCKKSPEAGKMICIKRKGDYSYARYMGDGFAELVNQSFPDRVFKVSSKSIVGSVIGYQVSD